MIEFGSLFDIFNDSAPFLDSKCNQADISMNLIAAWRPFFTSKASLTFPKAPCPRNLSIVQEAITVPYREYIFISSCRHVGASERIYLGKVVLGAHELVLDVQSFVCKRLFRASESVS